MDPEPSTTPWAPALTTGTPGDSARQATGGPTQATGPWAEQTPAGMVPGFDRATDSTSSFDTGHPGFPASDPWGAGDLRTANVLPGVPLPSWAASTPLPPSPPVPPLAAAAEAVDERDAVTAAVSVGALATRVRETAGEGTTVPETALAGLYDASSYGAPIADPTGSIAGATTDTDPATAPDLAMPAWLLARAEPAVVEQAVVEPAVEPADRANDDSDAEAEADPNADVVAPSLAALLAGHTPSLTTPSRTTPARTTAPATPALSTPPASPAAPVAPAVPPVTYDLDDPDGIDPAILGGPLPALELAAPAALPAPVVLTKTAELLADPDGGAGDDVLDPPTDDAHPRDEAHAERRTRRGLVVLVGIGAGLVLIGGSYAVATSMGSAPTPAPQAVVPPVEQPVAPVESAPVVQPSTSPSAIAPPPVSAPPRPPVTPPAEFTVPTDIGALTRVAVTPATPPVRALTGTVPDAPTVTSADEVTVAYGPTNRQPTVVAWTRDADVPPGRVARERMTTQAVLSGAARAGLWVGTPVAANVTLTCAPVGPTASLAPGTLCAWVQDGSVGRIHVATQEAAKAATIAQQVRAGLVG